MSGGGGIIQYFKVDIQSQKKGGKKRRKKKKRKYTELMKAWNKV